MNTNLDDEDLIYDEDEDDIEDIQIDYRKDINRRAKGLNGIDDYLNDSEDDYDDKGNNLDDMDMLDRNKNHDSEESKSKYLLGAKFMRNSN